MNVEQPTINPLHVLKDEELVSRLVLARDLKNKEDFIIYRKELMYRLRKSNPANWIPPKRFTDEANQL